jgi:hypothetical protein
MFIDRAPTPPLDPFLFTYDKPCTIFKFLSRAALQPDDFENPTSLVEVSTCGGKTKLSPKLARNPLYRLPPPLKQLLLPCPTLWVR